MRAEHTPVRPDGEAVPRATLRVAFRESILVSSTGPQRDLRRCLNPGVAKAVL